jgi:hypothetical protein
MVVLVWFTVVDPMRIDVEKLPGVIAIEEAFVIFQESVLVPAKATIVGDAEKEEMEGKLPLVVVADALVEDAETLPTESFAVTSYQ